MIDFFIGAAEEMHGGERIGAGSGGSGVAGIAWVTGLLAGLAAAGQDVSGGVDLAIGTWAGATVGGAAGQRACPGRAVRTAGSSHAAGPRAYGGAGPGQVRRGPAALRGTHSVRGITSLLEQSFLQDLVVPGPDGEDVRPGDADRLEPILRSTFWEAVFSIWVCASGRCKPRSAVISRATRPTARMA
jgi:hypothetical protein